MVVNFDKGEILCVIWMARSSKHESENATTNKKFTLVINHRVINLQHIGDIHNHNAIHVKLCNNANKIMKSLEDVK